MQPRWFVSVSDSTLSPETRCVTAWLTQTAVRNPIYALHSQPVHRFHRKQGVSESHPSEPTRIRLCRSLSPHFIGNTVSHPMPRSPSVTHRKIHRKYGVGNQTSRTQTPCSAVQVATSVSENGVDRSIPERQRQQHRCTSTDADSLTPDLRSPETWCDSLSPSRRGFRTPPAYRDRAVKAAQRIGEDRTEKRRKRHRGAAEATSWSGGSSIVNR